MAKRKASQTAADDGKSLELRVRELETSVSYLVKNLNKLVDRLGSVPCGCLDPPLTCSVAPSKRPRSVRSKR